MARRLIVRRTLPTTNSRSERLTNRNERHMREDGLPVPSRLADDGELFALCAVVSASNSGVIQMNMGRHCVEQIPQYDGTKREGISCIERKGRKKVELRRGGFETRPLFMCR